MLDTYLRKRVKICSINTNVPFSIKGVIVDYDDNFIKMDDGTLIAIRFIVRIDLL